MKHAFLLLSILWSATLVADQPGDTPVPPPPSLADQEEIEPEVVIIQREDKTIEEYRVNGQLYMIKVIPKNAPSYFLVDSDGNGSLDARRSDLEPDLMIPNWVLFRW